MKERSPDLLVTCDERDITGDEERTRFPKLIVEVLSPQKGDDLDRKPKDYRVITSVQEYAIVDWRERRVVMYACKAPGRAPRSRSHSRRKILPDQTRTASVRRSG